MTPFQIVGKGQRLDKKSYSAKGSSKRTKENETNKIAWKLRGEETERLIWISIGSVSFSQKTEKEKRGKR